MTGTCGGCGSACDSRTENGMWHRSCGCPSLPLPPRLRPPARYADPMPAPAPRKPSPLSECAQPLQPGRVYQMGVCDGPHYSLVTLDLSAVESPAEVLLLSSAGGSYGAGWAQRPESISGGSYGALRYQPLPGTGMQVCVPAFAGEWSQWPGCGVAFAFCVSQECGDARTGEHSSTWYFLAEETAQNLFVLRGSPHHGGTVLESVTR